MFRIIQVALWTGARHKEIANLQWQHVEKDSARFIGKGDGKERFSYSPKL